MGQAAWIFEGIKQRIWIFPALYPLESKLLLVCAGMKIHFGMGEIVFLPDSSGFNMPATNGLSSPCKTLEVAYGGVAYPFQETQLPSLSSPNPFIEQGLDTSFFFFVFPKILISMVLEYQYWEFRIKTGHVMGKLPDLAQTNVERFFGNTSSNKIRFNSHRVNTPTECGLTTAFYKW